MRKITSNLVVLLLALAGPPAPADVVLSAENLNAALKDIQRAERQLDDDTGSEHARAEAWYALGRRAAELTGLLNAEVRAHGLQQEALLQLALRRCKALGVNVYWSPDHEGFFYDGAAFREYLERAPQGAQAAESLYQLVTHDFYHVDGSDRDALEAAATRKRELLERYPDFREAARVGMYLGIDYRDLWRLCRDAGDSACALRYFDLASERFTTLMHAHAGSDTGEIARRLLSRMAQEAGTAAPPEP